MLKKIATFITLLPTPFSIFLADVRQYDYGLFGRRIFIHKRNLACHFCFQPFCDCYPTHLRPDCR